MTSTEKKRAILTAQTALDAAIAEKATLGSAAYGLGNTAEYQHMNGLVIIARAALNAAHAVTTTEQHAAFALVAAGRAAHARDVDAHY